MTKSMGELSSPYFNEFFSEYDNKYTFVIVDI